MAWIQVHIYFGWYKELNDFKLIQINSEWFHKRKWYKYFPNQQILKPRWAITFLVVQQYVVHRSLPPYSMWCFTGLFTSLKARQQTSTGCVMAYLLWITCIMFPFMGSYGIRKTSFTGKTSNISRTLVGNKIVDNSDVVGASPVGAAPTTSSLST